MAPAAVILRAGAILVGGVPDVGGVTYADIVRDVYIAVPVGTAVVAVADDFDRANELLAGFPAGFEVQSHKIIEEGD